MLKSMRRAARIAVMAAATFIAAASSHAAVLFDDVSRGAYNDLGVFGTFGSGDPDGNYLTGTTTGRTYHSFFVFDLTGLNVTPIGGAIVGATLRLNLANGGNVAFGDGALPTATLGIFDYSGDLTALSGNGAGIAGFDDLGGGTLFGSAVVSTSDEDPGVAEIVLNADAVAALTAAQGGLIAFGGAITDPPDPEHFLFGNSRLFPLAQLDLDIVIPTPVPEPATLALFGVALVCIGFLRRHRT